MARPKGSRTTLIAVNFDTLGRLPVNCTVYDLLNFVSEVATHHANEHGSRASQAWLGTLISGEYDLEDSCDSFDDFQDFFLDRKLDGEISMELQKVAV